MKSTPALLALVGAIVAMALPADAASKHRRAKHVRPAPAAQTEIACTIVGCHPVPRGCHREMGYTMDGIPTGFDIAVCGNYTLYGNRR